MKARSTFGWMAFALALAGVGIWQGRAPFHRWQERRMLAAAQAFFDRGDLRSATLSARQALQNNPRNVSACVILARAADQLRSPAAVVWRQRIAEIQPADAGALLDLAATATRYGEPFVAGQALAQVKERDRDSAAFHQTSATLAIAEKQFALADEHLQKMLERDPQNEALQLNLAALRLGAANAATAEEARSVLERLRKSPSLAQPAARALLTGARKRGDTVRALELAAELHLHARATFEDDLLYLEELQHARNGQFDEELRTLQVKSAANAGLIYGLMTWMNAHGLAARTLEWSATLPPLARGQMPVPLAVAEAYAALGEWKRLRELVANGNWGELDFLRFAIHARVLDETAQHARDADFKLKWERALHSTRGDVNELSMLARLVAGWGWNAEAVQVWWRIANGGTGQRPALKALSKIYAAEKNTRELYRVNRRILQLDPANPVAKNNVAALALLLGEDTAEAHRLAEENFRALPDDPTIASTRALSLHQQKRTREAVEIMAKLAEPALREPSIAACYGVLLAAHGEREKAAAFLEKASDQKSKLLAEEIALVENARHAPP